MNYSGPTAATIYTDRNFENTNAIGGCNMDFADTEARGYVYKSNDPKNVELKFIMSTDLDGGFSVSQTSGKHSGSGCCSGFAYMINMECNTNPVEFRFRKEMWHVSYHTDPKAGDFTHPKFNFSLNSHGNVGIGFVKYIKKDGRSSGHDSVIIEFWGNPDPDDDPENWILIKRTEDKGGWGNDGDDCGGLKDQVGTWGMPKFRLKSNSEGDITFRHMSLREINPDADFGNPNPTPTPDDPGTDPPPVDQAPTTSTIIGSFSLKRDINISGNSPCAIVGLKSLYYYLTETDNLDLSDNAVADYNIRAGIWVKTSASVLHGKIIKQLDVKLKKIGSPASTPVVNAKIINSAGSIKYTSPTNLDPTTLTGTLAIRSFDFSTNTYTMQTGDRIYITYLGTSDTDYVTTAILGNNADGSNTQFTRYEEDNGVWVNDGVHDFVAAVWED